MRWLSLVFLACVVVGAELPSSVSAQDWGLTRQPRGRQQPTGRGRGRGTARGRGRGRGTGRPAQTPAQPATERNDVLVARYLRIVEADPRETFAFRRLVEVYRERDGNVEGLITEMRARVEADADAYAHPRILDGLTVDYYGTATPLNQAANITVEDARTLAIVPWEKSMVSSIEKAILKSDLGLNPNTSGDKIRLGMPPLTEENRRDLTRIAKSEAENAKVAIRNIRRDANSDMKDLLKDKDISEDEERGGMDTVQKLTDAYIKQVDGALSAKETDLMEI